MTAQIINLNKVRKAKARAERERAAGQNRAQYGVSKIERQVVEAESDRVQALLDGALRQTADAPAAGVGRQAQIVTLVPPAPYRVNTPASPNDRDATT